MLNASSIVTVSALALFSFSSATADLVETALRNADVEAVAARLQGEFSNAEQVAAQPLDFSQIEYSMCPIEISGLEISTAARLRFAEQTIFLPNRLIKRYALYIVEPIVEGGVAAVQSAVFTTTDGLAGMCGKPFADRVVDASVVKLVADCRIPYRNLEGNYVGETSCSSTFQGSARLQIHETLLSDQIQVWERWFDSLGNQVAGSKVGPYIYRKQSK
jgi:hypothetical protein